MIIQKTGFLVRIRTVLTALVVLAGLGTTLMSMKPADSYKYRVAETAGMQNWEVRELITDPNSYTCEGSTSICTVDYSQQLDEGALIPKNDIISHETGVYFPN